MKKVLDFLRKIGLLQVSSWDYISWEFDDRKNIKSTKKNISNAVNKKPIFFWIILFFWIIIILISLILLWFSFWFFIIFIIWVGLIIFAKKSLLLWAFIIKSFTIYIIISIIFSFFIIIFTIDNTSTWKYTIIETTDYNIVTDNKELLWDIKLVKKKNNSWDFIYQAKYNFIINTYLKNDDECIYRNNDCNGVYSYRYIWKLETSKPDKYENPWNTGESTYDSVNNWMSPVTTFKNWTTKTYYSLDEFLSVNIYKLIDWSKYEIQEKNETIWNTTSTVWIMNQKAALESWKVARTYEFNINEIK